MWLQGRRQKLQGKGGRRYQYSGRQVWQWWRRHRLVKGEGRLQAPTGPYSTCHRPSRSPLQVLLQRTLWPLLLPPQPRLSRPLIHLPAQKISSKPSPLPIPKHKVVRWNFLFSPDLSSLTLSNQGIGFLFCVCSTRSPTRDTSPLAVNPTARFFQSRRLPRQIVQKKNLAIPPVAFSPRLDRPTTRRPRSTLFSVRLINKRVSISSLFRLT